MTEQITQASSQSNTPGYWQDANGNLVPQSRVKPIDQLRDQTVYQLCAQAETESLALRAFKLTAMADVAAFVSTSLENYGVHTGGTKGNVTLVSCQVDPRHIVRGRISDFGFGSVRAGGGSVHPLG
jgi:hypothetical protein